MTQLQAVRKFASMVAEHQVIIARQRLKNNWAMCINIWSDECRLMVPDNFKSTADIADGLFRKDFVARYNPGRGFSNTTLTILHEVGHYKTRTEIDWFKDEKLRKRVHGQKEYMMLESERRATDWAIQWLYSAEHRRLAKQFEKEFFGY